MALNIGIVGLPNVGKSTVFNALSGAQNAEVANYPFCTIHPNRAIVPLPDERLDQLARLVKAPQTIHTVVEFVDIAGLVKGAHRGEGLGNQFLGQIRDAAALLHVVRCFDDPNIVHVSAQPDPCADIEVINLELALVDLEQVERKLERLEGAVKADKKLIPVQESARLLHDHLQEGHPASNLKALLGDNFNILNQELRLLTAKPLIYVANVDENGLSAENPFLQEAQKTAAAKNSELVVLCAKLEQDLFEIDPEERREYLELSGIKTSGLDQVILKSFELLNLISFFTYNEKEARAWNVARSTPAPHAAGTIHSDFETGFIKAEVVSFDTFVKYGSVAAVKAAGLQRLEGKEYLVEDGDVIYFRFNI